jgi:ubiquinone/menaquinone biosynthesis C-methylase UbiE
VERRYVIRGGRAGYERLRVLHAVHGPATRDFFDLLGVGPGMGCVDLGCGGGEVTFDIADRAGPAARSSGSTWTR